MKLRKSLFVSFVLHLSVFLLLSFWVTRNQFSSGKPSLVTVEYVSGGFTEPIEENKGQPKKKSIPAKKAEKPVKKVSSQKNIAKTSDNKAKTDVSDRAKEIQKQREIEAAEELKKKMAEEAEKKKLGQELGKIEGDVDKALEDSEEETGGAKNKSGVAGGDPLSGVEWRVKPRKTLFFPNIESKIPPRYKTKGMSYALKAKISFDKNGLAVKVDIIQSSGDPAIDSIFFSELRKIRVEAIHENRIDEISKTFTISLK